MNKSYSLILILLIAPMASIASKQQSTYSEELALFKKSDPYNDLFNKDTPVKLRSIQAELENCKELTFLQRYRESIFIHFFNGIVVTKANMPKLYSYIENLCNQKEMAMPPIFIPITKGLLNAMTKKLFFSSGAILIGQDLIKECCDDEIEAVIAHELGHIKHNHENKDFMMLLSSLMTINLFLESKKDCDYNVFFNFIKYASINISSIPSMLMSKYFERQADEFACSCGKADGLITFFENLIEKDKKIDAMYDKTKYLIQKNKPNLSHLSYYTLMTKYYLKKGKHTISKAINRSFLGSHPSHEDRIKAARDFIARQKAIAAI